MAPSKWPLSLSARVSRGPARRQGATPQYCSVLIYAGSEQAQLIASLRGWAEAGGVERIGRALVEAELAASAVEPQPQHIGIGAGADHPLRPSRVRRAGRHGPGRPGTAHAPPCPENAPRAIRETASSIRAAAAALCSRPRWRRQLRADSRICSISPSLSAGIIGALSTPVGTPASASAAIVSSRRSGVEARGSITRARLRSRVVTEIVTIARLSLRHLGQDVEVAPDQRRFADDRDRMTEIAQHFEDRAGDLEPSFDRLIGIGVAAQRDRSASIALLAQFGSEQARGLRLVEQPAFEIEAWRQAEIGVARPRIAIDAAVLATAIGVDRAVEADIGRVVASDDRARRSRRSVSSSGASVPHRRGPAIVEGHSPLGFKATAVIAGGAASLARSNRARHIHAKQDAVELRTYQELNRALGHYPDLERSRDAAVRSRNPGVGAGIREIIVADGGSLDQTIDLRRSCRSAGCCRAAWTGAPTRRRRRLGIGHVAVVPTRRLPAGSRDGRKRSQCLSPLRKRGARAGYFDFALDDAAARLGGWSGSSPGAAGFWRCPTAIKGC